MCKTLILDVRDNRWKELNFETVGPRILRSTLGILGSGDLTLTAAVLEATTSTAEYLAESSCGPHAILHQIG